MASELARARLLSAILSLVLPVTFGHADACRNPALNFSAEFFCHKTFRLLFHRLAPFPLVLGYSRPLVGVNTEGSEVVYKTPPSTSPPAPLRCPHPPPVLRTSRSSAVSCPPYYTHLFMVRHSIFCETFDQVERGSIFPWEVV